MKRLVTISTQLRGVFSVSLLRSLASAVLSPIFALYIKQFVHSDQYVSTVIALSYLVGIIASVFGSTIIAKLQKKKTMILALLFFTSVLLVFPLVRTSSIMILFYLIYTFLFTILLFNTSLYIDHFSSRSNLSTHFGENGVITNLGWFIGPILGGFIAKEFSYVEVFLFASFFALLGLIIFIFSESGVKDTKPYHPHHLYIRKNMSAFLKNPVLRRMYLNGLGINIFYGTYMLIPVFLLSQGASISQIGIITGFSAIPWILCEYPIGRIADRKANEPWFFVIGYVLLGISLMYFGMTTIPFQAFMFLFAMIIGTSFIENTVFSYYYRYIPETEIETTSVFLTHWSFGYFVGIVLAVIALSFMSLATFFSLLGVLMLLFALNAFRLKPLR